MHVKRGGDINVAPGAVAAPEWGPPRGGARTHQWTRGKEKNPYTGGEGGGSLSSAETTSNTPTKLIGNLGPIAKKENGTTQKRKIERERKRERIQKKNNITISPACLLSGLGGELVLHCGDVVLLVRLREVQRLARGLQARPLGDLHADVPADHPHLGVLEAQGGARDAARRGLGALPDPQGDRPGIVATPDIEESTRDGGAGGAEALQIEVQAPGTRTLR